jgi:hypothetical protein
MQVAKRGVRVATLQCSYHGARIPNRQPDRLGRPQLGRASWGCRRGQAGSSGRGSAQPRAHGEAGPATGKHDAAKLGAGAGSA